MAFDDDFDGQNDEQKTVYENEKNEPDDSIHALADLAIETYLHEKMGGSLTYRIDHAFAHFRNGEPYADHLITQDLKLFCGNDPKKFFDDLAKFRADLHEKLCK